VFRNGGTVRLLVTAGCILCGCSQPSSYRIETRPPLDEARVDLSRSLLPAFGSSIDLTVKPSNGTRLDDLVDLKVFGGFQLEKREPEVATTLGGPVRSWSDERGTWREYKCSYGRIQIGCEVENELGRAGTCNDVIHAYPNETSPEAVFHTATLHALESVLKDNPMARVLIHVPEPSGGRQASILVEERRVTRLSLIKLPIP
jgi:hypothetical protein